MYIICAVIKMLHTFTKRYSIKKLSFLIKNTNLPTKRTNNDKGGTWGNIDRRVGKNIRSIKKNLKLAPNICYAISYVLRCKSYGKRLFSSSSGDILDQNVMATYVICDSHLLFRKTITCS